MWPPYDALNVEIRHGAPVSRLQGLACGSGPGGSKKKRPEGRSSFIRRNCVDQAVSASASPNAFTSRSISAFSVMNGGASWIVSPP